MKREYMTIDELNDEQLEELRGNFLCELFAALDMGTPSWGDLARPGNFITDDLLFAYHENTRFCDGDFSCTAEW